MIKEAKETIENSDTLETLFWIFWGKDTVLEDKNGTLFKRANLGQQTAVGALLQRNQNRGSAYNVYAPLFWGVFRNNLFLGSAFFPFSSFPYFAIDYQDAVKGYQNLTNIIF